MKQHFNTKQHQQLIREQRKKAELYLAVKKHKQMKKTFRGIYSYPERKILYKLGVKNSNERT